ncbi:hypothetical protein K3G63_04865 [Hymenobacter sp. HSC-4F20]|uniref:hypothetical protein n=1 Tax=Hymenobacter sp. HSC-4F20 TaxID=2864135 RepID=UPI001C729DB1|nr:hypothetical protein [Hymenobacter sp. HSC-4F20]MBX0289756.1 hypothetical protein [Hymenobacter sp. HSC-4F20]
MFSPSPAATTPEPFGNRLLKLMELLRLKPSAFAAKLDMKPQTLNGFTGPKQSGVTLKTIQKIIAAFPRVNSHWLITGEGSPLLPASTETSTGIPQYASLPPVTAGSLSVAEEQPQPYASPLESCKQELALCQSRIKELEGIVADKQLIIELLTNKRLLPTPPEDV